MDEAIGRIEAKTVENLQALLVETRGICLEAQNQRDVARRELDDIKTRYSIIFDEQLTELVRLRGEIKRLKGTDHADGQTDRGIVVDDERNSRDENTERRGPSRRGRNA